MDKTLRSILWILVGLVVLSSLSTTWFFLAKERLYNEYTSLEELFKNTMERLNKEISAVNKEKTELKSKLSAIEEQFKTLQSSNDILKSEHEITVSERESLKRELASVKKGRAFLEKRLKEMESDMFVANLLKDKIGLEVEVQRLKNSISPREAELERIKSESLDKDARLSKLQKEKILTEQKLMDSEQVAQILSRDLVSERESVKEERSGFEKVALENNSLKAKIAGLAEIAREYNTILAEKENMKTVISRLENSIASKEEAINKFRVALQETAGQNQGFRLEAYHSPEEVELPPIVVSSQPQKTARLTSPSLEKISDRSGLRGRIVTVNKEHNFVVIDLGSQDGINIGNVFNVYRGEILLGAVEVIQMRDRIAAADIKDLKEGLSIEINDTVVKR